MLCIGSGAHDREKREEEREIAHAVMRFLACDPTLADILFLVASIQHDPGEVWRTSLALRAHSRPSEQKEYLYHFL